MASVNTYPNEITPLVRVRSVSEYYPQNWQDSRTNHAVNKVVLLCFVLILLVGSFCGAYLLVVEGEGFEVIERFDFVTQDEWGVNITQADIEEYPSNLPFTNVLLIFILKDNINKQCNNSANVKVENVNKSQNLLSNNNKYKKVINESDETEISLKSTKNCSEDYKYNPLDLNTNARHDHKNMSKNYDIEDILYNFYVNEEGTIFEGRGFSMKPFCRQCDGVLAIGYKGTKDVKFTNLAPKIKAFLDYSTSKNNLNRCFKILVNEPDNSIVLAEVSNLISKLNEKTQVEYGC